MKKRIHRGSNLRDFLRDEGILDEVEERAIKKALAIEIEKLIANKQIINLPFTIGRSPVKIPL